MTLTYRSEYRKCLATAPPEVALVQEWLADRLEQLEKKKSVFRRVGHFKLLPHCMEKTIAPASVKAWQAVFQALGQKLDVVPAGCCGMSGTYGHETSHRENSAKLFSMSWHGPIRASENQGIVCATGYSCRSQAKREAFVRVPHPLQLLLAHSQAEPVAETEKA